MRETCSSGSVRGGGGNIPTYSANVGRDLAGRFVKGGAAPNPAGKLPGTRNRATALLDRMAEQGAKAVLEAVLTAAKGGDIAAAALILSRIWTPRRGRPIRLDLPDLAQPGGAAAALAAIAKQAAAGIISCDEAGEISKVVEAHMRATDVVELVHCIERLEAALAAATAVSANSGHPFGAAHSVNGRTVAG